MAPRRPESVLVVVFTLAGEVLVLQRVDDCAFWQSVTGSLEHGESALQAAHRELFEETGLRRRDIIDCQHQSTYLIRADWRHRYADGVTHNTEHVFLAPLPQRLPISLAPDEHLQHKWVDADAALDMLWSPSNRQAVEQFVLPRLSR